MPDILGMLVNLLKQLLGFLKGIFFPAVEEREISPTVEEPTMFAKLREITLGILGGWFSAAGVEGAINTACRSGEISDREAAILRRRAVFFGRLDILANATMSGAIESLLRVPQFRERMVRLALPNGVSTATAPLLCAFRMMMEGEFELVGDTDGIIDSEAATVFNERFRAQAAALIAASGKRVGNQAAALIAAAVEAN